MGYKGSWVRPMDKKKFNDNFDEIFNKKEKKKEEIKDEVKAERKRTTNDVSKSSG